MYDKINRTPGYACKFQTRGPELSDILEDVAKALDVPLEAARSRSRKVSIVAVKRIYCYVSTVITDAPLKNISTILNLDHSSVITHRDNCVEWFDIKEPKFLEEWNTYVSNSSIWGKVYPKSGERSNHWTDDEWFNKISERIKANDGGYFGWEFQLDTGKPTKTICYHLRKLIRKGKLIGVRHSNGIEYRLPDSTTNTI
jgi:hypothetical protein